MMHISNNRNNMDYLQLIINLDNGLFRLCS